MNGPRLDVAVLTLFPQMFENVLSESILKRAIQQDAVGVELVNFRAFATDKHQTVDDAPFGGGAGMVLKPDPLFRAVEAVRRSSSDRVILLSPQGRPFNQRVAEELVSGGQRLILICGHYEGFDERVRQHVATDEISLGDFVMTGGEIAAMAMLDTMVRLIPGVLGNSASAEDDSFATGRLEYPQYTRPAEYRGFDVPSILLSGNHQQIEAWRRMHALYRTWSRRPDMLGTASLTSEEQMWVERWQRGDFSDIDVR